MYLKNNLSHPVNYLFIIVLAILISACDSSTSVNDNDDEHEDAFGIALIMNGVEIASQENGEITYADGSHIEMSVGEESPRVSVRFIAEDGDRFVPDDDDFSLNWNIDNDSVLEIEQHEEDGRWAFHFVGVGMGDTDVKFELLHNNHADFESLPFEIHVEETVTGMELRDNSGNSIVSADRNGDVNGVFQVESGSTTDVFKAFFLDTDGNEVDTEDDYELEWHLNDSDIASINTVDDDPFSFTITGSQSGTTNVHFTLHLEHTDNDDDHSETNDDDDHEEIEVYESPDIEIIVD